MTALSYVAGGVMLVGEVLIGRRKWQGWVLVAGCMPVFFYMAVVFSLWGLLPLHALTVGNAWLTMRRWREADRPRQVVPLFRRP